MIKKRDTCLSIFVVTFILLVLLGIFRFITRNYAIGFPGGYRFYETTYGGLIDYNERLIDIDQKLYIGPNVAGYHVYSNIIVGKITEQRKRKEFESTFTIENYERRLGYFIIDLRTKKVYGGLKKHEWIKKLKEYGVNNEPKLHKPSFWDDYLGRNKP